MSRGKNQTRCNPNNLILGLCASLSHTFLAHSSAEALLEAAVAALVAFVFIDDAVALKAARVDVILAHRATEKTLTAVTRGRAVVPAGGTVLTYRAVRITATAGRRRR